MQQQTQPDERTIDRTGLLPAPHRAHATCAWCRRDFTSISGLLDHVDNGHASLPPLAA